MGSPAPRILRRRQKEMGARRFVALTERESTVCEEVLMKIGFRKRDGEGAKIVGWERSVSSLSSYALFCRKVLRCSCML